MKNLLTNALETANLTLEFVKHAQQYQSDPLIVAAALKTAAAAFENSVAAMSMEQTIQNILNANKGRH